VKNKGSVGDALSGVEERGRQIFFLSCRRAGGECFQCHNFGERSCSERFPGGGAPSEKPNIT
jgi:hypothetical protein